MDLNQTISHLVNIFVYNILLDLVIISITFLLLCCPLLHNTVVCCVWTVAPSLTRILPPTHYKSSYLLFSLVGVRGFVNSNP